MMCLPMLMIVIFHFGGLGGILIAFEDYIPGKGWYVFGSEFNHFANFVRIFNEPTIWKILANTIIISLEKIVIGTLVPIVLAILLNEILNRTVKKFVQTCIFIPYFISWVILSGIFERLFTPDGGSLVTLFASIGIKLPNFIGDPAWFRSYILVTAIWKGAGYTTIIHLAAISGIDPGLYEAAKIDGANRWQLCWHITIPGMILSILLMCVLNMGNILNAGFDQIYQLYSESVYVTGDVLDTYIYRIAFEGAMDYGLSTATNLLKSIVSLIFMVGSYWFAYKKFDYKVI